MWDNSTHMDKLIPVFPCHSGKIIKRKKPTKTQILKCKPTGE